MANSTLDQTQASQTQRTIRIWVLSLASAAALMFVLGLWLATQVGGVPRPWMGLAFAIAMGLAIVVGLSKTSSA
jgi:hypothetical protein